MSHDVFGVTSRDLDLARAISAAAADLDVVADPSAASVVEIALDTPDYEEIKPFWRAVLGLEDSPAHDQELLDLSGALPTLWFQATQPHDEPRQRFHLDVRVPPEIAEDRVACRGGRRRGARHAPSTPRGSAVLADAQGNKACVTTGLRLRD